MTQSKVTFAEGTNGDSPRKAFKNNSPYTNGQHDRLGERAELCFNMHNKITVVERKVFADNFVASLKSTPAWRRKSIFAGLPQPKGEAKMYKTLVSTVCTPLDSEWHSCLPPLVGSAREDQRGQSAGH